MMVWFKRFADSIVLPDGRTLLTLQDASDYIAALPEVERKEADWKVARHALTLAAENNMSEWVARFAILKAMKQYQPPAPEPPKPPTSKPKFRVVK